MNKIVSCLIKPGLPFGSVAGCFGLGQRRKCKSSPEAPLFPISSFNFVILVLWTIPSEGRDMGQARPSLFSETASVTIGTDVLPNRQILGWHKDESKKLFR